MALASPLPPPVRHAANGNTAPNPARRLLRALSVPLPLASPSSTAPSLPGTPAGIELDFLPRLTTPPAAPREDRQHDSADFFEAPTSPSTITTRSSSPRLPWPTELIGQSSLRHRGCSIDSSSNCSVLSDASSFPEAASCSRPTRRKQNARRKREAECEAIWKEFWS